VVDELVEGHLLEHGDLSSAVTEPLGHGLRDKASRAREEHATENEEQQRSVSDGRRAALMGTHANKCTYMKYWTPPR
jgi:hypothetical protein